LRGLLFFYPAIISTKALVFKENKIPLTPTLNGYYPLPTSFPFEMVKIKEHGS